MRLKFLSLALLTAALAIPAGASAQSLPDTRTHVDGAADVDAAPAQADPTDAPRLTLLRSATTARHVKLGYLVVQARCNLRCEVTVVATAKIGGKKREIGTVTKLLRANKVKSLKIKIRSDVKREIAAGRGFSFKGTPSVVL